MILLYPKRRVNDNEREEKKKENIKEWLRKNNLYRFYIFITIMHITPQKPK